MAAETLVVLINRASDNTPASNFESVTIDSSTMTDPASGKYKSAIIIPISEDILFTIDDHPDLDDESKLILVPKGSKFEIFYPRGKRIAVKPSGTNVNGNSGNGEDVEIPTWSTLVGKPAVIAAGADQAAARAAIGAGTSNLVLGSTATTAMPGDTVIPAAATWANLSGKPAVIAAGADQAAARAAIGAGTSDLQIGTTSTTAKAGDSFQNATQTIVSAINGVSGTNVQAVLAELAARIAALESSE